MQAARAKSQEKKVASCICGTAYRKCQDNKRFGCWVGCESCETWCHARCVGFSEKDVAHKKNIVLHARAKLKMIQLCHEIVFWLS